MRSMQFVGVPVILIATAAASAGCGTGKVAATPNASASACKVKSNLAPVSAAEGSTIALGRVGKNTIAFVADEDARSIIAIDLETKKEVARTRLSAAPSQVIIGKDGRMYAALRDNSKVAVLESEATDGSLALRCEVDVASDPQGLALTPDQSTLLVTSGFGRTASGFETQSMKAKFAVEVPREPRGVVVTDDGKTAFISHAVGSQMTVLELGDTPQVKKVGLRARNVNTTTGFSSKMKRRAPKELGLGDQDDKTAPSCQGFALAKTIRPHGRILAPQVMVDPGDLEQLTPGYGRGGGPSEISSIAVIDEESRQPVEASLDAALMNNVSMRQNIMGRSQDSAPRTVTHECLLPRSAAVDPVTGSLLVTCVGIDALVAYDQASPLPVRAERKRWAVGSGPTGVAVEESAKRAVVWSQFDRSVQVISLDMGMEDDKEQKVPRIALAKLPAGDGPSTTFALGRVIFHSTNDARISHDGRACASCHPDGRDDAITWATPEGPRRSIMLAGRLQNTAPYSWLGKSTDVTAHVGHTFDRLGGAGLHGIELDALVTYLNEMHAPAPMRVDSTKAKRGAEVFASKETGCADCHKNGVGTDSALHNVYSKAKADETEAFNTPSLHLVGGTGPYFHDGRYKSLRDLLRATDGKMGHTSQLSENDIEALETYVRSL